MITIWRECSWAVGTVYGLASKQKIVKQGRRANQIGFRENVRFKGSRAFIFFSILFVFVGTVAHGEGLYTPYTRTDELSCGNALVQASTTCDVETDELHLATCTDQHFLFLDPATGASVRVEASGEHDHSGLLYHGLAVDWACLKGQAGPYVVIGYGDEGGCGICTWDEVFDVTGGRHASNRERTDEEMTKYETTWHSLGLPEPWPWASFISIQLFKDDRSPRPPDSADRAPKGGGATGATSHPKPAGKVKWLVFSPTGHQHEREMVMKQKHISRRDLGGIGAIYIALADLNDDGTRDIFAYIDIWAWCGTMGCSMNVYRKKGRRLVPLLDDPHGSIMFMDIDRKGYQKTFGILPGKTMGRHDIAFGDQWIWTWNGKEYREQGEGTEQGQ